LIIVIPARGGSKRLPRKNIRNLCGKPLLAYTIESAIEADLGCPVIVSTEDSEIAEISKQYGATVIRRPSVLAKDNSTTEEALLDVIEQLANTKLYPQWIMTLPPTSPLRSSETIKEFYDLSCTASANTDCIMSVSENLGDFWRSRESGDYERLFPEAPRRQQERTPLYEENSSIYLTRVSALQQTESILGNETKPIIIDPLEAIDINTETDLWMVESLILNMSNKSHD